MITTVLSYLWFFENLKDTNLCSHAVYVNYTQVLLTLFMPHMRITILWNS